MNVFCYNVVGDIMAGRKKNKNTKIPVLECLEASVGTEEYIEMVLGLVFMFFGFVSPLMCFLFELKNFEETPPPLGLFELFAGMLLFFSVFGIIGLIFFLDFLKPVVRMHILKRKGKKYEALVCEYVDDNRYIDGAPTQVVKLLIKAPRGEKVIYYQLGTAEKPYEINSKVKVKMYRNIFRIIKEENK